MYAAFVIGVAFIKYNFLWITHDDANLLQQAILIANDFSPNIDYFSGYPGLSLYMQSILVRLFGTFPYVQHVYSALLFLALGILFFWIGRNSDPIIVFAFLFFSYSQSLWLNPTPNPGYLFDLFFILGLLMSHEYFTTCRKRLAIYAGVFFGVAFCSKQYGLFGPLMFFIGTIALLNVNVQLKRLFTALICFLVFLSFLAVSSSLGNRFHGTDLILNTAIFVIPALVIIFILCSKLDAKTRVLSVKTFLYANTLCTVFFILTVYLYFLAQYGSNELVGVIYQIMIAAPSRINEHFLPVSLSLFAILKTLLGLTIIYTCTCLFRIHSRLLYCLISAFLLVLLALVFYKNVNLSATVFVPSLLALIAIYFVKTKSDTRHVIFAMILGITPILLLLITYPKPTYHIPLLFGLLLMCSEHQVLSSPATGGRIVVFLLASAFVATMLFNLKSRMDLYPSYRFSDLTFKTEDKKWEKSISEASFVQGGSYQCKTYGCRYLLLTTQGFTDFYKVIEHPDNKNPFE